MKAALHSIGASLMSLAYDAGGMAMLLRDMVVGFFTGKADGIEFWRNMYRVGVKSFSVVTVTALLVGGITAIQTAQVVSEFGATALVGWGTSFATLREIGPILIGLMFSGRVGANNTAELGTMAVTDQVDALRALAINPTNFLLAPRFVAIVFMMVLLTIIGDVVAIVSAAGTTYVLIGVDVRLFYASFADMIVLWDFFAGLVKSAFFGVAIALVSCYYGINTSGGAVGVGRSVNAAVVASAVSIFVLDYFLAATLP